MLFLEKALVAIDDSEEALNAFLEALRLSRQFGFRLAAVCVTPLYEGDLSLTGVCALQRTLNEPCLTILDEAVRIAQSEGVGLATFRAEGKRHETIIDLAVREKCRLIIIGQNPGIPWTSLGGLTAKLLRYSRVDVLITPNHQPVRINRILCCTRDCQRQSGPSKARQTASLDGGKASLTTDTKNLTGLSEPSDGSPLGTRMPVLLRGMQDLLPDATTCEVMVCSCFSAQVLELAKRKEADLIVMKEGPSPRAWNLMARLQTLRIVRQSLRPLWIVKE
jgi:nucleotide-binding universal stress UspA family protein